jgi:ribose 5-phosphate isomerase B
MKKLKIALASDHAGYKLKENLKTYLIGENYNIKDFGTYSEESVDYPDYFHPLAKAIEGKEYDFAIAICGSGNGANMTVNKYKGIRSALCWNKEIARLARAHNDANICALPGRFINIEQAIIITRTFLTTGFDGGRHAERVKKIPINHFN